MKAKHCGVMLVIGAAVAGACHGDGPTVPRTLTLAPYCTGFCLGPPEVPVDLDWLAHLSGVAGAPLSLEILVTDGHASPVPGITFRWSVVGRGGSVDSATSVSDTAGVVRVRWTLDTLISVDSLVGRMPSGDSIVAIAAVRHAAAAVASKASGDSQVVAVGDAPRPLVVRVTDRYANPVPGVRVAWALGGLGTLATLTTTTGADGTTSNTLDPPATAGVYEVIATFGNFPALVFTAMAR